MRLWKRFDGEPFMVNPRLGILGLLNPKGSKVARLKKGSKAAKAYMAKIRGMKNRKRKARSNPFPMGGPIMALANRRRKRGGGKRSGSRRHVQKIVLQNRRHRRRHRRNPILGIKTPPLQAVLYTGAGFAGAVALESVLTSGTTPIIPVSITGTTLGKYAVRVGCVIAEAFLASKIFGGDKAKMVGIGGGVYVITSAISEFAPGVVPGLSGYRPMASYKPMAAIPFGQRQAAASLAYQSQLQAVPPRRFQRY